MRSVFLDYGTVAADGDLDARNFSNPTFVGSGALRAQNLVDLILDLQQFRFIFDVPYSSTQCIE